MMVAGSGERALYSVLMNTCTHLFFFQKINVEIERIRNVRNPEELARSPANPILRRSRVGPVGKAASVASSLVRLRPPA